MAESVKKTTASKKPRATAKAASASPAPVKSTPKKKAATNGVVAHGAATNGAATNGAATNGSLNGKGTHPVPHDEIALLAHQFWAERGGQHGSDFEDWFRAEQALRGKAS